MVVAGQRPSNRPALVLLLLIRERCVALAAFLVNLQDLFVEFQEGETKIFKFVKHG